MVVAEVRSDTFRELVLESDEPVVVDFHANWCQPCHLIAPEVEALAEKWDGRIRFAKVDIDELPHLALDYGVMSIPTVILFQEGVAKARTQGARPAAQLEKDLGLASLTEGAA